MHVHKRNDELQKRTGSSLVRSLCLLQHGNVGDIGQKKIFVTMLHIALQEWRINVLADNIAWLKI